MTVAELSAGVVGPGPGPRHLPASGSVLSVWGLRAQTGHLDIGPLSFDVRSGEAYGLLGPLGSGKTSVVRMACGIVSPSEGDVLVQGRPIAALEGRGVHTVVGYVPRCVAAMPAQTVADNLRFWARLTGLPPAVRDERIGETLAVVGLEDRAADVVSGCPSGVQRRLGLAVALLHRPRLLVLDDPVAGIDERSGDELLATLARLRDGGAAVLYASTEVDEVAWLCDRIGLLGDGRLRAEVRPSALLDRGAPSLTSC